MGWDGGKVVGYKGSGRFCLGMLGSIKQKRKKKREVESKRHQGYSMAAR